MIEIGYALSSEEHAPNDLVRYARKAEEAGFTFALISDHYHPWVDRQGHSPFVWSVIGAIAHATERLRLGTGVTCPTTRIHPAIIAQAAATAASMMPGRFFLGLGTGENLNEHILGDRWPAHQTRLEMLEEAVEVIRLLWEGGSQSHLGDYFEVEKARIYTLPDEPPPIFIAGDGQKSAELAGRIGDGRISTSPESRLTDAFRGSGGKGKPMIGQMTVCWAGDEAAARRTAFEWWPNAALGGELFTELRTPSLFEQACELATEEKVAENVVCGPDRGRHIEKIREFIDGGFEQVYVHQVGPDQEGFMDFYRREILREFAG
ncbi:MAG TPA: TIGR03557 family F420-dependent LLM class oxidoreductase [Blastocatellia bacterium]|jgi:G6PDH family F420-dependent oxidoreductase|nr:TIGR03557 family F420-dependent LLM class oxidoreductase [Blastocatellia bacterium]